MFVNRPFWFLLVDCSFFPLVVEPRLARLKEGRNFDSRMPLLWLRVNELQLYAFAKQHQGRCKTKLNQRNFHGLFKHTSDTHTKGNTHKEKVIGGTYAGTPNGWSKLPFRRIFNLELCLLASRACSSSYMAHASSIKRAPQI